MNMPIKIGVFILIFMNLNSPIVNADSQNLKQCFYIVSENKDSKDLSEDLKALDNMKIPVFVVINPNSNIHKEIIAVLESLQKESKLRILLENNNGIEKSYFAVQGYANKLNLYGLCNIQKNKLLYMGQNNISFSAIKIKKDPLETMSEVNLEKEQNHNYALVINGDEFNISTLLLAWNELQGLTLEVPDYRFYLESPSLIYVIFTYVGDVTVTFFAISIIIFVSAIIIFKKWSQEMFINRGK
ncbi:hypothetical protein Cpap_3392 [Ruminiclostridium papyrosolvens DSM 2782]|uniref:Uncharacterized protein n=2 Tax=Ruminiclostridium papyrosolvens TaxID=29362 RepID=F1T8Y3_9FIRM|nr:hypothetical protein [Ruminiclostridium papyrosolvens]EGD48965.1 hypothetical protein Cpap_3392 [Ruminiclostridium papyrosolvens DSM 2782]